MTGKSIWEKRKDALEATGSLQLLTVLLPAQHPRARLCIPRGLGIEH